MRKLTGWKGDFWEALARSIYDSRDLTPAIYEPGERTLTASGDGDGCLCVTASISDGRRRI